MIKIIGKQLKSYTEIDSDAMHWYYELNTLGYKYNMNDLAASIGLVQLKKLDKMNEKKFNYKLLHQEHKQ